MIRRRKMSEKSFPLRCISCNYQGVLSVERGVARRDASRQIFARYADAGAGCSIISTMLAHSWGGIKRAVGCRSGTRGRGGGGGRYAGRWCTVLEWKGVQSISRKSVCTARSPNAAATLSSYSFDRNPLGLCTQSLMALFKDRYRSMTKPSPSCLGTLAPIPVRAKEESWIRSIRSAKSRFAEARVYQTRSFRYLIRGT